MICILGVGVGGGGGCKKLCAARCKIRTWTVTTFETFTLRPFYMLQKVQGMKGQWGIYIVKFWTRAPPPQVQILSISCSFGEILENRMLVPPGGLAPAPRGNPGSATEGGKLLKFFRFALLAFIDKYGVLTNQWTWLYEVLLEVSMTKIALWIRVCADDWAAKSAIKASNGAVVCPGQNLVFINLKWKLSIQSNSQMP